MFSIFFRALDRGRKSLIDLIPDLDSLRRHPENFLANGPVVIGSAPRLGRAVLLGVLVTMVLLIVTALVSAIAGWQQLDNGPQQRFAGRSVAGPILMIAFVIVNCWIANRLMSARLLLSREGVEVHDLISTIICPWSLFSRDGSVTVVRVGEGTPGDRVPEASHIFLPIDGRFLSLIEKRRRGVTVRRGEKVKNWFFRIANREQAVLADSFRVNIAEIGKLIVDIGNVLGRSATPPAGEEVLLPIAFKKAGWIEIPFARLAFPFLCCSCGEPTQNTQTYVAHDWIINFGRFLSVPGGQHLSIQIPKCRQCQEKKQRRLARGRTIGCLSGAMTAVLGCTAYYLTGHESVDFCCAGGGLTLGGAFVGYWLGNGFSQDRVPPVATRRLSTNNGTVELRFREVAFTTAFLAQFK